jgi:hypothetical protein
VAVVVEFKEDSDLRLDLRTELVIVLFVIVVVVGGAVWMAEDALLTSGVFWASNGIDDPPVPSDDGF